jgi:hypothetical protein
MDAKIKAWLEQLYQSNKWFFYTVVPLATILILVVKFRDVLINQIIGASKKGLESAEKTDSKLATTADQASKEADADVKQADSLPSTETQVDEDWNKDV